MRFHQSGARTSRRREKNVPYVRFSPEEEEEDVGGLEEEEEEEEEVLRGKEVFTRREEGARTLERLRGITALGGGATLPW